jgi:predicted nucleic acid-binding protein
MGLKVIGTLGVLALGHIRGFIDNIEDTIKDVKEKGFFVSENQIEEIKNYIGKMLTDRDKSKL